MYTGPKSSSSLGLAHFSLAFPPMSVISLGRVNLSLGQATITSIYPYLYIVYINDSYEHIVVYKIYEQKY